MDYHLFVKNFTLMSFTNELTKLAEEKRWYEFTLLIINNVSKSTESSEIDIAMSLIHKNMTRIHPLSLKAVSITLFNLLSNDKFIEFADDVISAIISVSTGDEPYTQEIITVRLYKNISLIKKGIFENIESQIISLRTSELSIENENLLYLTAALFYEGIGNIEEAQQNLFLHAKETKKVYDIEKLIRLSMISTNFFDFAAISSYKEFNDFEGCPLKELFIHFQEGNIENISEKDILKILNINNISHIKEKMYILNIMKICFNSEQKFILLDHLASVLNIDQMVVIKLILRALGLKVISGWIDSDKKMLFFDYVLPRALNQDEMKNMRSKFIEWRNRVQGIIDIIEQS